MKLRITLMILLMSCVISISFAQTEKNYGTDAVAMIVKQANFLYNKGKFGEAKVLYEQALASGDKFFFKKCTTQLNLINSLLAGKKNGSTTIFTISQDTVRINCMGGEYPIHVSGNNWTVLTNENSEWLKIEIDRKRNLVMITSSPNADTDNRSTVITIKNGNGQRKSVKVINEGSPEVLRSSAQNLVFTPIGETNIVDIDANTTWDITDVPEWLKAIKGNRDIQFTAAANEDNKDRIAQVKVETPSKNEITINVIQSAALDSLAFSKNNLHFGPEGGDEYIRVFTDADDWRFGDFPHWCQLTRMDANTILVHCTPNEPVDMPREASVNVTTGSQTLGINVSQAPKPIVHIIPQDGIGGRKVSFGFSAGYIYPMISANSSSLNTFSPVNYAMSNKNEQVNYSSSGGFTFGVSADIRLYKNFYLNTGLNFVYYKYKNNLACDLTMTIPQTSKYYLMGNTMASFEEEYTMATLDLPVLASYRIPITKKSHFQINLGPVVCLGLSSKLDFSGKTNSEELCAYKIINGQRTNERYDNSFYGSHLGYAGSFDLFSKDATLRVMTSDGSNDSHNKDNHFDASPYKNVNFGLKFGVGYEYMGISLSLSYQWVITNMGNKKYWDGDRWIIFDNGTELMTGYSQRNNLLQITFGYTFRY